MTPPSRSEPLSSELAQRAVGLVAPLISHNINIMDEHGTVLASADPDRVGTLHRGAQQAIAEQQAVLIYSPDPDSDDRPGANEPLVVDGEVRGVVGVTGDPNLVAPLARLVALTVQLMVDQERRYDTLTHRNTEARDLIAALASGTTAAADAASRLEEARLLEPWTLTLHAHLDVAGDHRSLAPDGAEGIATTLNADDRMRAAVLHGALWILSSQQAPPREPASTDARVVRVRDVTDVRDLLAYAEELRALCRFGRLIREPDDEEWSYPISTAAARLPQHSLERLAQAVEPLTDEQRRTVRVWGAHPSSMSAASAMYLHRNTLIQRIERIRVLSGFDLRIPDDLTAARMAVAAAEALGS